MPALKRRRARIIDGNDSKPGLVQLLSENRRKNLANFSQIGGLRPSDPGAFEAFMKSPAAGFIGVGTVGRVRRTARILRSIQGGRAGKKGTFAEVVKRQAVKAGGGAFKRRTEIAEKNPIKFRRIKVLEDALRSINRRIEGKIIVGGRDLKRLNEVLTELNKLVKEPISKKISVIDELPKPPKGSKK